MDEPLRDTSDGAYARRLEQREGKWWKRLLNVQAPYQWNLRRQRLGRTLDVGCGIGRNLVSLDSGSVGVDHNADSCAVARQRGFQAMTWAEFKQSDLGKPESFDSILLAHVIEHMPRADAQDLLGMYLPYLRPGGKVFMICPQERGYASDPTHIEFTTGEDLEALALTVGLLPQSWRSFPFPRWTGKWFLYNEFNLLATKPVR